MPTLTAMISFKTAAESINIAEHIGMKYSMLGPLLLNDTTGVVTEAMEGRCHHDAANINLKILQKWISGGGIQPIT